MTTIIRATSGFTGVLVNTTALAQKRCGCSCNTKKGLVNDVCRSLMKAQYQGRVGGRDTKNRHLSTVENRHDLI